MSDPAHTPTTAEAFLAWTTHQQQGRYELAAGKVVRMAAERAGHARTKLRVASLLEAAVHASGLACEVFGDGMAVLVDEHTVYEPDALLRCGARLDDDAVIVTDPVVVVEVVSPSSAALDTGAKLADYFRIPSVQHYLIVRTKDRTVIQHSRTADAGILTRIVREGAIRLDPPGLDLAGLFDD